MIIKKQTRDLLFKQLVFILFISCAAVMSPPGGPKDETPPELIEVTPPNGTTHFKGGRVELLFSEYIDENARQFRFSNGTTTDDHAIHLIGYKIDENDNWWFLIKDSGSGSRNGNFPGYYFYHEDFVKLKMMTFTIHKDAVKETLDKIKRFKND